MTLPRSTVGAVIWIGAFVVSAMITGRADAELLPELEAVDAQIARAITDRPDDAPEPWHVEQRIQALIPDARDNCVPVTKEPQGFHERTATPAQVALETALRQIRQSDVGAWMVQVAAAQKVTICLDHGTELEAHYRSHLHLIGLNARLDPAGRVVFLAHELAHVPQHPRFSNNRQFAPADMVLLQRVREAAAEAVATRVLWQLRQQGVNAPWRKKLTTAYHDIAEAFEASMAEGDSAGRELWATRSAFHHWFTADWRLEIYDDLMLRTLRRIAEDPIGLVPASRHLSDGYLRSIADYASQRFLIGGDGEALISSFRAHELPAGGQARLDAIIATAGEGYPLEPPAFTGETLSAISPPRVMPDQDR